MTNIQVVLAAACFATLAACDPGGTSTEDVKEAAAERAREKFGLPADAPLETAVWTGEPFHDDVTVCGTVSSAGAQQIRPQRFIATLDPFRWQLFEEAHSPMIPSQPGKFPQWSQICGQQTPGTAAGPAAVAQPAGDERCGTRLDSNQDGIVQEAEYNSFNFAFDNWDVDGDYRVSPAEFQRCWDVVASGSAEAAFGAFDEDGNGFLDQEEFFSGEEFQRWDSDGDGAIPRAEFP